MMRRLAALRVTLALVGVACVPPPPPGNINALTVLGRIRVANPNFAGYQRTLFHYPQDADHDHCDTRAEVLLRDSATPVVATPSCTVVSGRRAPP